MLEYFYCYKKGDYNYVGFGETAFEAIFNLITRSPAKSGDLVVQYLRGSYPITSKDVTGTPHGIAYPGGYHNCIAGHAEFSRRDVDDYVDEGDMACNVLMRYIPHDEDHCPRCHTKIEQESFILTPEGIA